jgi:hypothetical protein
LEYDRQAKMENKFHLIFTTKRQVIDDFAQTKIATSNSKRAYMKFIDGFNSPVYLQITSLKAAGNTKVEQFHHKGYLYSLRPT